MFSLSFMLYSVEEYNGILEEVLITNPELIVKVKELDEFFRSHSSPIDIAIILNRGLKVSYLLAHHMDGNNILTFRPQTTHKGKPETQKLEGMLNPHREILLIDDDMVWGDTMIEGFHFFNEMGYNPNNIYCYLVFGSNFNYNSDSISGRIHDIFKV
jgi:orotate phosphoribosyltransferase